MSKLWQKLKQTNTKQRVLLILLIGLLIRIPMMPFLAHEDLYLTYGRSYGMAFEGKAIFSENQQFSHLVQAINLKIYDIFFAPEQLLPLPLPDKDIKEREVIDSGVIFENPMLKFNIFWMKIPYLLFDLGTFYLLWLIVKREKSNWQAMAWYWLNPVFIFAVYAFARYESFPVFFLTASMLFTQMRQSKLGALSFGMAIIARSSILMLLPIYVLTTGKNLKDKILNSILAILPYVLVLLPQYFTKEGGGSGELTWVTDGRHTNFVLSNFVKLDEETGIYIFIIGFVIIAYYAWQRWVSVKEDMYDGAFFKLIVFMWFYATSFYHPQYLAWTATYWAVLTTKIKDQTAALLANMLIWMAFPVMLLTWREAVFGGLARPLNEWLGTRDLAGVIDNFYPSIKLANLAKSVMSAGYLLLMWQLIRDYYRNETKKP